MWKIWESREKPAKQKERIQHPGRGAGHSEPSACVGDITSFEFGNLGLMCPALHLHHYTSTQDSPPLPLQNRASDFLKTSGSA